MRPVEPSVARNPLPGYAQIRHPANAARDRGGVARRCPGHAGRVIDDARADVRRWRGLDWFFRSRETGKVVIVQVPNLPLALFLLLRGAQALLSPDGAVGSALHWTGTAALLWWSVDELLRGVNPFRRLLGAATLGYVVATAARALAG